jgi:hypothetical protein
MRACRKGNVAVAKLLVDKGAKVEIFDTAGRTAIDLALHTRYPKNAYRVLQVLVDAPGANAALRTKNLGGGTPLATAIKLEEIDSEWSQVVALLRTHGATMEGTCCDPK